MSQQDIVSALEQALAAATPGFDTAWENVTFAPTVGTPYQKVATLFAEPDNPSFGAGHYRERGIFQVTLMYPMKGGAGAARAQAAALRGLFKRGATFSAGTAVVVVERTPEIPAGSPDGDRWSLPVKVRFYSDVFTG